MVIQIALVLSIAGKYLYERKTCPRVWVRAAQFDPNAPLRGRYLSMQLSLDACGLPRDERPSRTIIGRPTPVVAAEQWTVRPVAQDGKLIARLATDSDRPEYTQELTLWNTHTCDRAVLSSPVEYFIADTARTPFPLQPGQELWVEVTVPRMGPPRPIQLAVSQNGVFTPLKLD